MQSIFNGMTNEKVGISFFIAICHRPVMFIRIKQTANVLALSMLNKGAKQNFW